MSNSAENHYDILSPYAPQMPKPLPQMLHLAIKNAPEHMKAAISNSLFPAFGSLMHNVGFRYPDNVFHEPHFMCGLIGPMSIGKGSIPPRRRWDAWFPRSSSEAEGRSGGAKQRSSAKEERSCCAAKRRGEAAQRIIGSALCSGGCGR